MPLNTATYTATQACTITSTCTAHALLTILRVHAQTAAPPSFCMLEPNIGELIFRLIHVQTTENIRIYL